MLAAKGCAPATSCPMACRSALYALKEARCFGSLTQPQHLQPRMQSVSLAAMAGVWYGLYPANGVELLELNYDQPRATLAATKLTGNAFVSAGRVSWEATPSGCRVVSSLYAGAFSPRWDPCVLTMHGHDHIAIDLGGEDTLNFVRAKAELLLEWGEERAPTFGLAAAFARCEIETQDAQVPPAMPA